MSKTEIKAVLANLDYGEWQAMVLLLFFMVMLGVFVWVFRPHSKTIYEHAANLALDKEDLRE